MANGFWLLFFFDLYFPPLAGPALGSGFKLVSVFCVDITFPRNLPKQIYRKYAPQSKFGSTGIVICSGVRLNFQTWCPSGYDQILTGSPSIPTV